MSDLNVAAAQLESNIDELHEKVTTVVTDAEGLKQVVEQAKSTYETEWQKVQEDANHLRDLVHEGKDAIDSAIHGIFDAIGSLGEEADHAKQSVETTLQEAQHELEDLMNNATQQFHPQLEEVLKHLEEVSNTFSGRVEAIQGELHDVVTDAHQFLANETVSHMTDLKGLVEQGHETVKTFINGELTPQIQQHVEDYLGHLGDIGGQLQQHFEEAGNKFHEHASNTMQDMMSHFTQNNEHAQGVSQHIDGVMDMFKQLIDVGGETVGTGKQVIDTAVSTTSFGLQGIIDTLEELKEFFSRFSFISL